ncbi:MAG TPA: phage tail protein [Trinickia sp.]
MSLESAVGGALHALEQLATEPFKAYNFRVVLHPDLSSAGLVAALVVGGIASLALGSFTSVTGIGWETEVHTVRQGGENDRVRKLPGRTTCGELVLTKGLTLLDPMWQWYCSTMSGNVLRMNGTIFLMADAQTPTFGAHVPSFGLPIAAWNFYHAWPRKLEGVQFDASNSSIAVQHLALAIDRIKKIDGMAAPGLAMATGALMGLGR